jgi:hypothetical protein
MTQTYEAEKKLVRAAAYPYEQAFVAGGAITSVFTAQPVNDADIYFKSRAAFEKAVFQSYEEGFWCVDTSKRAVTFSYGPTNNVYQLMHFDFFETAEDIFKAFDYTINMAALDLDSNEFIFHDDFLKHCSQRFLRFNKGTRYPLASLTRVLKYQQRGYTIGKGDMLKIALACRGVKLESWEDLKDQIGGAYGNKVVLDAADQDFSLDAAIDALIVAEDGRELWCQPVNDNDQPSNADGLLRKIAELNGVEYAEGPRDSEGWPVLEAA